ncbi:MAG: lamin tail domain-containing protein, partial [Cryomorphaceae bacterium]
MKPKNLTSLLIVLIFCTASYAQECDQIFISEYVAGTGNNKAIELYNPTGEPIDLDGYVLERWSNGEQSATDQLNLEGVIPAFGTWVIVNGQTEDIDLGTFISPACDPALQALADQIDNPYPAPTFFNGNDALVLLNYSFSSPVLDIFGKPGQDPGAGWTDPDGNNVTALQTLIRKAEVTQGVIIPPAIFMPLDQWVPIGTDTWSNLGEHSCECNEDEPTNEIVIYTNEFDDLSEWTFINEGAQGSWNVTTEQNQDLIDFMGTMQSATAENGFGEFVGITFLLDANVDEQNSILELNEVIDCSNLTDVRITFNQRARAFNYDLNFLEVSNDNGASYVPFEVNGDLVVNADAIQNDLTVDVTSIAAGSSQVKIRFRWISDALASQPDLTQEQVNMFGSGYGWMVDDLVVSSSGGCNVSVDLGDTLSFCNQEAAVLDAGDGYATYTWNTGENTGSIEVNAKGTYS